MIDKKKRNEFIDSLQKMELNYKEALIYFKLIKYGQSGTIVRKLNEELHFIDRTTIYSILRRLIEKACVIEGPPSDDFRRATTFIAIEPAEYFNKIFLKKKQELVELREMKQSTLILLQNIYESGLEISSNDLDAFILPYFQPLLKKEWKVKSQKVEQGLNLFGGNLYYEYQLQVPRKLYKNVNLLGFLVSIFDSDVENNKITLKFFIHQLKKIIKQMHQADFNEINISDGEVEYFTKLFPTIIIKAKDKRSKAYLEFGRTVILPIKNKIFFIWEELRHENVEPNKTEIHNVLKIIVKQIFKIEGISIENKKNKG
ncbi:MAG: hypothetical protein ACFFAN_08130 [Promethearchaeota archaeon]